MENEVTYLYLDDVIPNRFQPRENFDEQALKELAVSIKEHGVIQPIVVRKIGEKYEIIAGERRYKASTMAGLTKIPAIIRNLDDKESSKVALIENLQRKDLTPIEEARTYQKILELDALTQEELAKTMGKSQSAVSNKLRLLSLTDEVQEALLREKISERHARSLLNIENPETQKILLNKIISTRMTVRELEEEIKRINPQAAELSEEKEPPVPNTFTDINPTTVNIDQIRNQSQDIIKPSEPLANIDNLLRPAEVPEKPAVSPINAGSLFENPAIPRENSPIGGSGLLAGMSIDQTSKPTSDNFNGIRSNISDSLMESLPKPSVPPISSPSEPTEVTSDIKSGIVTKPKDMQETIKGVKSTIEDIKKTGIKVDLEEFDFEDFYQIVVRIDKDNF